MRLLLSTDSFPPLCGGSGWSTSSSRAACAHEGTTSRGAAKAGTPAGRREREYDGIRVVEFGFAAPALPYVRNYFKNERLYPRAE